jgi:hypothetical protein
MSIRKKRLVAVTPVRSLALELEFLYARRSALDDLIESLEDYARFKASQASNTKRKSA